MPLTDRDFTQWLAEQMTMDPSHDLKHVKRVVKTACSLAEQEGACLKVVRPAAWLHDCVNLAKDHPERHLASRYSADLACRWLADQGYNQAEIDSIHHAISAHSFSANIPCETLEAKVLQDADRLDSLGAIGLVRTIQVSTLLNRPIYSEDDPFCQQRNPDDLNYCVDHFYIKLLKLAERMNTQAGYQEAKARQRFLEVFLEQLATEI